MKTIDDLTGNTQGFAKACYDMNSIAELEDALALEHADKTDCKNWDITPEQWSEAITAALNDLKRDCSV